MNRIKLPKKKYIRNKKNHCKKKNRIRYLEKVDPTVNPSSKSTPSQSLKQGDGDNKLHVKLNYPPSLKGCEEIINFL